MAATTFSQPGAEISTRCQRRFRTLASHRATRERLRLRAFLPTLRSMPAHPTARRWRSAQSAMLCAGHTGNIAMRRMAWFTALVIGVGACYAANAQTPPARVLLEQSAAAMGGLDRLRSLDNVVLTGFGLY